MKENESSLNSTLNSIFNPLSKRKAKELGLSEEQESRYISRLVQEIDTTGKENAIAVGTLSKVYLALCILALVRLFRSLYH
jgi:chromosome transmission fidelity protein 18